MDILFIKIYIQIADSKLRQSKVQLRSYRKKGIIIIIYTNIV